MLELEAHDSGLTVEGLHSSQDLVLAHSEGLVFGAEGLLEL